MALNIEIKATCRHPEFIRGYLEKNQADFKGTDLQVDTYFNVSQGRLKLREGNIENNLIYYERNDHTGAKESNFQLIPVTDTKGLKEILSKCCGIKVIVEKKREIYFIQNVKFHLDHIVGLGNFVEIEASDLHAPVSKEELQRQCNFYIKEFGLKEEELVPVSYSD
ncbi:MAG TPA: class IV adenylate cyclase, partial [Chitinophagaceae bacterium]|nr:class IV adenylate cyclase [Chitinophagaceae bacterium]